MQGLLRHVQSVYSGLDRNRERVWKMPVICCQVCGPCGYVVVPRRKRVVSGRALVCLLSAVVAEDGTEGESGISLLTSPRLAGSCER